MQHLDVWTCWTLVTTNASMDLPQHADDMPAHVKSTLIGASINVPITNGKFNLGTWQGTEEKGNYTRCWYCTRSSLGRTLSSSSPGIYLCEHRNVGGWGSGHERKIVITIQGATE